MSTVDPILTRTNNMNQILRTNRHAFLRSACTAVVLLMLAACASTPPKQAEQKPLEPHDAYGANEAKTTNATPSSPGYRALKNGDYAKARDYIETSNAERPNDAFDELNLGVAYQGLGRMDLAEPLYRQAMTHGHGLYPKETIRPQDRGRTVEEIACANLGRGLKPASVAGTASPCQTTLVVMVSEPPVVGEPIHTRHARTDFNTYFEFDRSTLTREGREVVDDAADRALSNPRYQINLVGKASSIGASSYNWELSRLRANAVRDELIAAGVPGSRINMRWVGETELPVAQADDVREPLNRVVEGVVMK